MPHPLTNEELAAYLKKVYTHEEIAEMHARALLTSTLEALPSAEVVRAPIAQYAKQGRGRPNAMQLQQQEELLVSVLERFYPLHMPLKRLRDITNLTYKTIHNIAHTPERLAQLPVPLRPYLLEIIEDQVARLGPVQRAILDLHNNSLLVWANTTLPLYVWHWPLWGVEVSRLTNRQLSRANHTERDRALVPELVDAIEASQWWTLTASPILPLDPLGADAMYEVEGDCPVLQALLARDVLDRDAAREVLIAGSPLPLCKPGWQEYGGNRQLTGQTAFEVATQVLGVER